MLNRLNFIAVGEDCCDQGNTLISGEGMINRPGTPLYAGNRLDRLLVPASSRQPQ